MIAKEETHKSSQGQKRLKKKNMPQQSTYQKSLQKLRKMDNDDRMQQEELLESYKAAIGMK